MAHSTTTFGRICALYAEQQDIAAKDSLDRTGDDLARLLEIDAELPRLWEKERQARCAATSGPPRLIGNAAPLDRRRIANALGV